MGMAATLDHGLRGLRDRAVCAGWNFETFEKLIDRRFRRFRIEVCASWRFLMIPASPRRCERCDRRMASAKVGSPNIAESYNS
jgi:hypothetical protein